MSYYQQINFISIQNNYLYVILTVTKSEQQNWFSLDEILFLKVLKCYNFPDAVIISSDATPWLQNVWSYIWSSIGEPVISRLLLKITFGGDSLSNKYWVGPLVCQSF